MGFREKKGDAHEIMRFYKKGERPRTGLREAGTVFMCAGGVASGVESA